MGSPQLQPSLKEDPPHLGIATALRIEIAAMTLARAGEVIA